MKARELWVIESFNGRLLPLRGTVPFRSNGTQPLTPTPPSRKPSSAQIHFYTKVRNLTDTTQPPSAHHCRAQTRHPRYGTGDFAAPCRTRSPLPLRR